MSKLARYVYLACFAVLLLPILYAVVYGIASHGLYFEILGAKP